MRARDAMSSNVRQMLAGLTQFCMIDPSSMSV
jgi:hypothetical protein